LREHVGEQDEHEGEFADQVLRVLERGRGAACVEAGEDEEGGVDDTAKP
jgi:hypothetical protein